MQNLYLNIEKCTGRLQLHLHDALQQKPVLPLCLNDCTALAAVSGSCAQAHAMLPRAECCPAELQGFWFRGGPCPARWVMPWSAKSVCQHLC